MALERLELLITSVGGAAVKDIKAVSTATSEANTAQTLLQKTSNTTKAALDQLGLGAVSAGTGMGAAAAAGGALVAVGITKFALDAASATAGLAGEIRGFQRASGATAEESSKFVAVMDDLQVSTEAGSRAVSKLGVDAAAGGPKLAEFGIEVAKNKDGTTDLTGTLLNVSDAYSKMNDPAERARLRTELFGKAGKDLIPILEQGRKGLESFFAGAEQGHQIFTQEQLDNARQYELALDQLSDTLRGFQIQVGNVAIPVVTKFATAFSNIAQTADDAESSTGGLYGTLVKGSVENAPVIGTFVKMGEGLAKLTGIFDSGGEASNRYSDAQSKLKDAQEKVLNLAAAGKTGTKEYADAQRDATAAGNVLTGANQKVAESLQTVSDKAFAATQNLLGQAAASLNVSGSALAVKDAEDKLADAQRDANDAAQFGVDKSRDVEKAQLAVETAVLSNVKAAGDLAVVQLGPGASAQAQNEARSKAQREAFEALGGQIDDTTYNRLAPYLAGLGIVPPRVSTDVVLNGIPDVLANLAEYKRKLDAVVGTYVADVIVQSHGTFDPIPGITGQGIFGDMLIQAWPEAADKLMWEPLRKVTDG